MQIPEEHKWAFEIQSQILQLECEDNGKPDLDSRAVEQPNLMECRPWTSMLFNEASSLKAYNHYEYFLYQVPSLFYRWASLAANQPPSERPPISHSLANLSSFTYVAVFPFYNHVQLVLDAVGLMKNLRCLKIQLGPSENDRVTELEQRGSIDPSDPWMEIATGYTLIAHAVRNLGRQGSLVKLTACDYAMEAVRAEIDVILGDILGEDAWTHNGHGIWTKKSAEAADIEDYIQTAVDHSP